MTINYSVKDPFNGITVTKLTVKLDMDNKVFKKYRGKNIIILSIVFLTIPLRRALSMRNYFYLVGRKIRG